ncbi:MAG: hypothetical protein LBT45_02185 [Rickettsiales bacterium]|nr:hypothetical protein [Rickettsiales bacterium]
MGKANDDSAGKKQRGTGRACQACFTAFPLNIIKYKDSFFIPNEMERNNQKINDKVRLHFILKKPNKNEPHAERM